jgi:phage terminase large subunit-like protein
MSRLRIWISYKPKMYAEIFKEVIQATGQAEVVVGLPVESGAAGAQQGQEYEDVLILSLDGLDLPELNLTPERSKAVKVIAFSPNGERGLMRMPGKSSWEEIRPFSVKLLIDLLLIPA